MSRKAGSMTWAIAPSRLLRLMQIVMLNALIAVGITVFGPNGFWENFVYSQCIGLSDWVLIDGARVWLIRDWRLHWRRMVAIIPIGASTGYALGMLMADALLGKSSLNFWITQPRAALSMLSLSLVVGGAITYYFLSRAQIATAREQSLMLQRQAAESRLKLLESQLEPHMLFNTLANLRALIGSDPPRAIDVLDRMIDYLRATLNASRSVTHPLSAEFDRLKDYLTLMAVRMGSRLNYELDLPAELRNMPVPPLLLQPLVENSIMHGLEPKVDGGIVSVRARRHGNVLTLDVSDTGVGLSLQEHARSGGFGLAQVRERLATAYGKQAKLDILATHAQGVTIRISLPYQTT